MLTDLARLKQYLDIDSGDTSQDDFLTDILTSVSTLVKKTCGQEIESGSSTITFFGDDWFVDGLFYVFRNHKVNSITSFKYKEALTDSFTTVDSSKYELIKDNNTFKLYNEDGFTASNYYEIIASVGWSTVPEDIQQIAVEMSVVKVAESSTKIGLSRLGLSSMSKNIDGFTANTTFNDLFQTRWLKQLKPYFVTRN